MAQVLGNLIANAIAYSPATSVVHVSLSSTRADGGPRIEVANEGQPIPDDVRENLFDPFRRGHATSDATRSIGLGLYIVKHIVDAHHGRIEVTSEAGTGTKFTVTVPAVPRAITAQTT